MPDRLKRVICLWGAHRNPGRESTLNTPGNVDKGTRELEAQGYEVLSIYPDVIRQQLPAPIRSILGRRLRYQGAIPALLRTARSTDVPVHTTSIDWAYYAGKLKLLGLMRNRLVIRWAGFDADYADLANPKSERRRFYCTVLAGCDVCIVISLHEADLLRAMFPEWAAKVVYWPTSVDVSYYRTLSGEDRQPGLVAVGSDRKRDWHMPIELAKRGVPITLLTEDAAVPKLLQQSGAADKVRLAFKVGFSESARIMAASDGLFLSTLPNHRFSGSTSVGVAAALKKGLVLDEPYDLAAYGLKPGFNSSSFQRGDVDSAYQAARRLVDDDDWRRTAGLRLGAIADCLSTQSYAGFLGRCFAGDRPPADFDPLAPSWT